MKPDEGAASGTSTEVKGAADDAAKQPDAAALKAELDAALAKAADAEAKLKQTTEQFEAAKEATRRVFTEQDESKSLDAFTAMATGVLGWSDSKLKEYLATMNPQNGTPPDKGGKSGKAEPDPRLDDMQNRLNALSRQQFETSIADAVKVEVDRGDIKVLTDKMRKAVGDKPANALGRNLERELHAGVIDELNAMYTKTGRQLSATTDVRTAVVAVMSRLKASYADITEVSPGIGRSPEVSQDEVLLQQKEVEPPAPFKRGSGETADDRMNKIKDWAGNKWIRRAAELRLQDAAVSSQA